jgi:hypothetical protein
VYMYGLPIELVARRVEPSGARMVVTP